jgi:hypothetical protein
MTALVDFMKNPVGRLLRIALGVAIIATAYTVLSGAAVWVAAAVGLVPIAMGVSGRCLMELLPGARQPR